MSISLVDPITHVHTDACAGDCIIYNPRRQTLVIRREVMCIGLKIRIRDDVTLDELPIQERFTTLRQFLSHCVEAFAGSSVVPMSPYVRKVAGRPEWVCELKPVHSPTRWPL